MTLCCTKCFALFELNLGKIRLLDMDHKYSSSISRPGFHKIFKKKDRFNRNPTDSTASTGGLGGYLNVELMSKYYMYDVVCQLSNLALITG